MCSGRNFYFYSSPYIINDRHNNRHYIRGGLPIYVCIWNGSLERKIERGAQKLSTRESRMKPDKNNIGYIGLIKKYVHYTEICTLCGKFQNKHRTVSRRVKNFDSRSFNVSRVKRLFFLVFSHSGMHLDK